MYKFPIRILLSSLIIITNLFSQQYGKGILLDESHYENVTVSAQLLRGDFIDLPSSFSLKKYSPTPGNQGPYSTCAGWACAYSARTILNAVKNNLINPLIDENTFSPSYIYNQIRPDSTCSKGVFLNDALDLLKKQGVLPMKDFGYECNRQIKPNEKYKANQNRILEYREIFSRNTTDKVLVTKKSISEYYPVIITIDIPESFEHCKNIWLPKQDDYKVWNTGHALVVISYDDSLYGGAFEVINSWGTDWGDGGYTWISYKDFNFFTYNGFELIDDLKKESTYDLSGTLSFELENGIPIPIIKNGRIFQTEESFPSGTKFNVKLSNNQPAFVYALGADLTRNITRLFPQNDNISALLPYRRNNIGIPDDQSNLMLDDNPGKSYFCFIYSNKIIDIKRAINNIEKNSGDFSQKVFKYFKNEIVEESNLIMTKDFKIDFKAKSNGKTMMIIIVEIEHI
jgi:C1A family cysteine protease